MKPDLSPLHERARKLFAELWTRCLTPKVKRPVPQWATEERVIASGQSPLNDGQNIRYDHAVMPHAVEMMESVDNPSVNIIVAWLARRLAKTEGFCCNTIGRTVTDDPGNVYSMWPVQDSRDRFSRDVIEPMIKNTPSLDASFVELRSREAGRTIGHKSFTGGSLYMVFSGSPSMSRGMAAKVILCHEVDAFDGSVGKEGDPVGKALGRAEGFGDAIKIIEGTGTVARSINDKGEEEFNSRIDFWHEQGDQRKYFCPCQSCGALQWIKFEQIRFPPGHMENAAYFCEVCDHEHDEAGWRAMVGAGKWYPTAGLDELQLSDIANNYQHAKPLNPVIRSYWSNGFISLLPTGKGYASKLHQFVAEHATAAKDPQLLRVWVNEVYGGLWDPLLVGEKPPDIEPLLKRRESYAVLDTNESTGKRIVVPRRALVLTAQIDVQKNRLEIEWEGWSKNEESWGIDYTALFGEVEEDHVWGQLGKELQRRFQHELGNTIGLTSDTDIGMVFIDAGKWPDRVHAFLRKNILPGKIRGCRGYTGNAMHPLIDLAYKPLATGKKYSVHGHWVGTNAAKDLLYTRAKLVAVEPLPDGWMHFPMTYGESWFKQFASENVVDDGNTRTFVNPHQRRNEALDLRVYGLAAYRLLMRRSIDWDAIIEQLTKKQEETAAPQPKKTRPPRERGNFVTGGWRW